MLIYTFFVNSALHLPALYKVNNRANIDYNAYINQAGALSGGEFRYWKISSLQGPCFYPGGHLFMYLPAYWLHTTTEDAEQIMKLIFFSIHSLSLVVVSSISYRYFKDEP